MSQEKVMKNNLIEEIHSYYDHYVYMADVMEVQEHIEKFALFDAKKLDSAPNFFKIVYAATIDSYMLTFARLYDSSQQSKNMKMLIEKCKNSIELFDDKESVNEKLNEFEIKMQNDECFSYTIETLKFRRDKILAHNDKKFFVHPEKDNSYLPRHQLWDLRDFTKNVLEYLLAALGEKPKKKIIYDMDLENLIGELHD